MKLNIILRKLNIIFSGLIVFWRDTKTKRWNFFQKNTQLEAGAGASVDFSAPNTNIASIRQLKYKQDHKQANEINKIRGWK